MKHLLRVVRCLPPEIILSSGNPGYIRVGLVQPSDPDPTSWNFQFKTANGTTDLVIQIDVAVGNANPTLVVPEIESQLKALRLDPTMFPEQIDWINTGVFFNPATAENRAYYAVVLHKQRTTYPLPIENTWEGWVDTPQENSGTFTATSETYPLEINSEMYGAINPSFIPNRYIFKNEHILLGVYSNTINGNLWYGSNYDLADLYVNENDGLIYRNFANFFQYLKAIEFDISEVVLKGEVQLYDMRNSMDCQATHAYLIQIFRDNQ